MDTEVLGETRQLLNSKKTPSSSHLSSTLTTESKSSSNHETLNNNNNTEENRKFPTKRVVLKTGDESDHLKEDKAILQRI